MTSVWGIQHTDGEAILHHVEVPTAVRVLCLCFGGNVKKSVVPALLGFGVQRGRQQEVPDPSKRFWAPFKYHVSCISRVLMPYWTPTRCFRLSWPFSSCCQHFCQHHLPEQASRLENAGAAHSVNHSCGVTALLQHSVVSTSHGVSQIQEKGE